MRYEALKLVEKLNNDSFIDEESLEWVNPFGYQSDGNQCLISFLGVNIWDDDNDDRDWLEDDEDQKEPLIDYVLRESNIILKDMTKRVGKLNTIPTPKISADQKKWYKENMYKSQLLGPNITPLRPGIGYYVNVGGKQGLDIPKELFEEEFNVISEAYDAVMGKLNIYYSNNK